VRDKGVIAVQDAQNPEALAAEQSAPTVDDTQLVEALPDVTTGEGTDLATRLEAEQKRSAELLDSWQRARAEFLNYKRRVEQERQRDMELAGMQVIAKTLFVLDDFDLALANRPSNPEIDGWVNGVALIAHKMRNMLDSEGVQPMAAQGQKFDPAMHEAVMMEDGGGEHVVAELRRGYTLRGTVIRPALVKVGSQPSGQ